MTLFISSAEDMVGCQLQQNKRPPILHAFGYKPHLYHFLNLQE